MIRITVRDQATGYRETTNLNDDRRIEVVATSRHQQEGQDFSVQIEAGTVIVRDGRDRVLFRTFFGDESEP